MVSLWVFSDQFLRATATTVFIFSCVCIVSLSMGMMLSILTKFYANALSPFMRVYVWFFRGIPELIILFMFYLVLPRYGIVTSPIVAAILAFSFIRTAYDFEVFRGALEGVHTGQVEASRALGLPRFAMVRRVVMPQLIRIAVGPWVTQSIGAIKSISLASAISVAEIMHVTQSAIIATNKPLHAIAVAAAIYAGLSALLMIVETVLGRRFDPASATR